jgi:MoaA/NifB/PqqE/SkfB family radical SAM enzyme
MEIFTSILIQTNRKCTKACKHCFYGNYDFSNDEILQTDTIYKIFEELVHLNYKGRISLYANNEPLTDSRMFCLLERARELLPNAFHFLQTNGDLLNDVTLHKITSVLDGLQVNVYSKKSNYYNVQLNNEKVQVVDKTEIDDSEWSNKAGLIKSIGKRASNNYCANPFRQMLIAPPGIVAVCSSDAFMQYPLGDVRKQSLISIWEGEKLNFIREQLINKERHRLPLCSKCDCESGHMMELGKNSWKR